jgi:hypothetical protein
VKCEIWQSAPQRAQFRVCREFNVARRGLLKADITSAELWSCEVQCRRSRRAHARFALSRPGRALTYLMLIMRLNAAIRPIGMNLAPLESREVDIAKRSIERTSATTYGYPRIPGPLPNSHAKRFSDHVSALHAVHITARPKVLQPMTSSRCFTWLSTRVQLICTAPGLSRGMFFYLVE